MTGRGARDVTKAKWENPLLAGQHVQLELPRLFIQIERESGKTAARQYVHEGDICRIGSAVTNDLVLNDPTISRYHCSLQRHDGAWRIHDTDSTNGTRVDGVKILTAELEGAAVLTLGDSRLRVRADRGASRVAFDLPPGQEQVVLLRVLPAAAGKAIEFAVGALAATLADGSDAAVRVEGETQVKGAAP